MLKALGTFGYQIGVMGKDRYRGAIPRTVERLSRFLPSHDTTAGLGALLLEEGLLPDRSGKTLE
jgi:aminoglycoside/choline kinase family phosphotransferase